MQISEPTRIIDKDSLTCYHCGEPCKEETIAAHEKTFCCAGCKLVYEILEENNLCNYYHLNETPGSTSVKKVSSARYDFLDDEKVKQQLISFTDGTTTNITLFIPQIHCSSCLWLLEHFYKLDSGTKRSTVNFLKREVNFIFNEQETSLKKIVTLLNQIGYAPHFSLDNLENKKKPLSNRKVYYKLGVAFFCFGNIMLLSFPEYFGLSDVFEKEFRDLFAYLNLLLSLPVLLYADTDFFKSAWAGIRQGRLNMDFPISLGIIVMYSRSLYEILSGTGAGYMDTFAGLIFFMLTGRLFQNKSYEKLSFERDYKSYFPVSITVIENGIETTRAVSDIKQGARILVRNEELIPADAVLLKGEGNIDYSFVTGENIPVAKKSGDRIYAGGKQIGATIEMEVLHEVSQSRLTQLWNESTLKKQEASEINSVVDKVSKIFTIVVIFIAITAGLWHIFSNDMPKGLNAFTAVLIITCPCALALSYPFTLGNAIRILGNQKFYLKNTQVIEKLSKIDTIVFDKTGTITIVGAADVTYVGAKLSPDQLKSIFSLTSNSTHPLSRVLSDHLKLNDRKKVTEFSEIPGKGLEGKVDDIHICIGSASYTGWEDLIDSNSSDNATKVYVTTGNTRTGYFIIRNNYRPGLSETISLLGHDKQLHLLSGDNDSEKENLEQFFGKSGNIHFRQSPSDKLHFIANLQKQNQHVMMLGDGLNDAGALRQSNAGIAVSDNINNFSPACDAILDANVFEKIPSFLKFSSTSMKIIYVSYTISLLYNCVGIWFAIHGNLSPLFAAIIMPLSTVTIILFPTRGSSIAARCHNLVD
ncbi:MAG: heavy metal translocating P-type ATPase metal-binding domain-containing protein [Bacteroidetes bacterium]|nr:heavy metal translocating P-type ATPase metal-binding domain-containing protein [Bacteroidota bacterium]